MLYIAYADALINQNNNGEVANQLIKALHLGETPESLKKRAKDKLDMRNPHANVLPSKKQYYPKLANVSNDKPLDMYLRIPSLDTLGAFNAIYFCLKTKNKNIKKEKVIGDFLKKEFQLEENSEAEKQLVKIFLNLENTLKKIFLIDKNLYHGQSLLCQPVFVPVYAINAHMTSPEGTLFPTKEALDITNNSVHPVAFKGWPVPEGHICCGPEKIIAEKEQAVFETEAMLKEVLEITAGFETEKRDYLRNLFQDLYFFSRAFSCLTQAHVHYFLLQKGTRINNYPNRDALKALLESMALLAKEWSEKYPGSRYSISETLTEWKNIINNDN